MLLKVGSKGDDVKKLQTKLGLTADGSFGPKTEASVNAWLTKNGLTPDGTITSANKSWELMFGVTLVKEDIVIKPVEGLNVEKLKGTIPDNVISQIAETAQKFNITNNLRLAHFLAQCAHESGNFKAVSENLNYSVDGLNKGHIHLHGHCHLPTGKIFGRGRRMDVGIDGSILFTPYDLDKVIKVVKTREILSNMDGDHHIDEVITEDGKKRK